MCLSLQKKLLVNYITRLLLVASLLILVFGMLRKWIFLMSFLSRLCNLQRLLDVLLHLARYELAKLLLYGLWTIILVIICRLAISTYLNYVSSFLLKVDDLKNPVTFTDKNHGTPPGGMFGN